MADCIFCKIGRKEIPAKIVYEDRQVVAFEDINPQSPSHTLLIPKSHYATFNDVGAEEEALLGHMMLVATRVAKDKGLDGRGYRIVGNCMEEAGPKVFPIPPQLAGRRRVSLPPSLT